MRISLKRYINAGKNIYSGELYNDYRLIIHVESPTDRMILRSAIDSPNFVGMTTLYDFKEEILYDLILSIVRSRQDKTLALLNTRHKNYMIRDLAYVIIHCKDHIALDEYVI